MPRAWVLPFDDLAVLKGTYARLLIYTGSGRHPPGSPCRLGTTGRAGKQQVSTRSPSAMHPYDMGQASTSGCFRPDDSRATWCGRMWPGVGSDRLTGEEHHAYPNQFCRRRLTRRMDFAYRAHTAFVNLDPGESMRFALAPMTAGVIVMKIERLSGGGTDYPGDHPPRPGSSPREHVDWNLAGDPAEPRIDGRPPDRALRATVRRAPPGPGLGSGTAPEITAELMYGDDVVQTKAGANIFYTIPAAGAAWWLRMTRADDGSTDRRRYRVYAQYPSVLPLVDRRVPARFVQTGLDRNWNDGHQYLEMLRVEGKVVQYRWDAKLAELYDLDPREVTITLDLEDADLPAIEAREMRFQLGWTQAPIDPPATTALKIPYLALHIRLECIDSRDIDILGPIDIPLPREFWIEVRFHLRAANGVLSYDPEIIMGFMSFLDDVKQLLEPKIKAKEDSLRNKQWKDGRNSFDAVLRPWFTGHYELVDVEYDDAADDIVFGYVGKPLEQNIVIASEPPRSGSWAALPRLFASAEDERLLPTQLPDPVVRRPPLVDPGDLAKVKHIVVLMQENRSFDQVLGYLRRDGLAELGDDGLPKLVQQDQVDGLLPDDPQTGNRPLRDVNEYQFRPTADPVKFHSTHTKDTSWPYDLDNPCHGRDCVNAQISGGMKSFVADYARRLGEHATPEALQRIMNYYGADELPVYEALAREFAICDRWFCSHIGGTLPNRHITMSGDLNRDKDGLPEEDNSDFQGYAPSERLTFFDHLTAHNVSWRLFEHGYSFLRLYRNFTFDDSRIVPFDDRLVGFEELARQDHLPSVCFIEPDYIELPGTANDDHAPADMYNGQRLVARVVRALIRGGQWADSMLVITYDEHGGFYDHLPPPDTVPVTTPGGPATRQIPPLANGIRRLGPRVPAFVVSPYVPRGDGTVNASHTVYEHASIPATILRRFCGPRPPVMSPRVSEANDLRDLLTRPLAEPRPAEDFASLLQVLDRVADSEPRRAPGAPPSPVPTRKLTPGQQTYNEDFHGFIAYASATTGRSSPVALSSVSEGRTMPGAPVTAVVRNPGVVSLFLADPAGGVYAAEGNPADGWGPWASVSEGRTMPGAPVTAVVRNPGVVSLFLADPAGGVYAAEGNPADGWGPWASVSEGRTMPGAPVTAVVRNPGVVSLFLADPAGGVYAAEGNPADGWGPWASVSEGRTMPGAPVTAVVRNPGVVSLFAADPAGGVYAAEGNPADGWGPWASVSEGRTMPGAPVTAVVRNPGVVSLFAADPAGGVYAAEGNPADGWGPWASVSEGRTMPGAPVTAVVRNPGVVSLFLADPAGGVYAAEGNPADGWGPWRTVLSAATTPGAPVAAAALGADSVSLFVADRSGTVRTAPGLAAS